MREEDGRSGIFMCSIRPWRLKQEVRVNRDGGARGEVWVITALERRQ